MKHLHIFLIPGRFAFLKTYTHNQIYISNGAGFVRILQTDQDNHMTISEFENMELALKSLNVDPEQKIGIHMTDKQMELITYDSKQDSVRSMFTGGHSFERLQRSQLDFFYPLQKMVKANTKYPTVVFRKRKDTFSSKYEERLRIYGDVLLFPPTLYDLHHFLTQIEMDYVDSRFIKCLNHD